MVPLPIAESVIPREALVLPWQAFAPLFLVIGATSAGCLVGGLLGHWVGGSLFGDRGAGMCARMGGMAGMVVAIAVVAALA